MDAAHRPPRGPLRRLVSDRPILVVAAVLVVLLGVGLGSLTVAARDDRPGPLWQAAPSAAPVRGAAATPRPSPSAAERTISLSATGDIIMGRAPDRLPVDGGRGFFDSVRKTLAADLVMGNLEEPLTDETGVSKCGKSATDCFQFRAPPSYAAHLRDAGFELLNQANNHAHDYGPAGYRNTSRALEKHGLKHTGAPGQITEVDVEGVRVAVIGFSSYPWSNSLVDVAAAKQIVQKAADTADLVVVQVHMGAEGSDKTHVKPGTEMFFGENRGDPIKFSRAVVDAGADLVVGHGPHVLRGMEFHRGRLIAYSLGNFAGGGRILSNRGPLGYGGVLKVSLTPDGEWAGGRFLSTYMDDTGRPTPDDRERGRALIAELSADDFPRTGARLARGGAISPPR